MKKVKDLEKIAEKEEKGATMVEYALLVALIALIALAATRILGQSVSRQFSTLTSTI